MQLTFSRNHLGWIAKFATDRQLFFKIKTAWLNSNKQSITVANVTPQDVINTYSQISSQSEGLAAKINAEIDDALMPQLLNAQGNPKDEEAGLVVMWIMEHKANNLNLRQAQIDQSISELDV